MNSVYIALPQILAYIIGDEISFVNTIQDVLYYGMQQEQKETKQFYQVAPSILKGLTKPTKRVLKQKRTPEDVQSFVDVLKKFNFPEEKIPQFLADIDEIRASEDRSENYTSDRLYVGV